MIKVKMTKELYNSLKSSVTAIDEPVLQAVQVNQDIKIISDMIGKSFFFRTVTYHIIGKVVDIIDKKIIVLEQASWVADSGRFMNAIKDGTLIEVEPLGEWFVCLDTVTDFGRWNHALPNIQK